MIIVNKTSSCQQTLHRILTDHIELQQITMFFSWCKKAFVLSAALLCAYRYLHLSHHSVGPPRKAPFFHGCRGRICAHKGEESQSSSSNTALVSPAAAEVKLKLVSNSQLVVPSTTAPVSTKLSEEEFVRYFYHGGGGTHNKTKISTLLVVCHPDDESIWDAPLLGPDAHVIVVTDGDSFGRGSDRWKALR